MALHRLMHPLHCGLSQPQTLGMLQQRGRRHAREEKNSGLRTRTTGRTANTDQLGQQLVSLSARTIWTS